MNRFSSLVCDDRELKEFSGWSSSAWCVVSRGRERIDREGREG